MDILQIAPMGMQAFWIWLTLGILLLGIEIFLGTQWLLWASAAAGVVAVVCLTGLPFSLPLQVATFALLSVVMTAFTRRFIKIDGHSGDVNDPHSRIVGREAEILSGFEMVPGGERTGRVMLDGVEWPAVLAEGIDDLLTSKDRLVIERVAEGRLYVRPAA